jgi:glycogen debranching enzyme
MAVALVRPELLHAWKGPSLLIVDATTGVCGPDLPLSGYYFREARFLSLVRLEVDGRAPWLCEAASLRTDALALNFVHPEITGPAAGGSEAGPQDGIDAAGLPERALDFRVSFTVGVAGLTIALVVTNRALSRVQCELGVALGTDFADIQEAQSGWREQQASVEAIAHDGRVELAYQHPGLELRTHVDHGGRFTWGNGRLTTPLVLDPQQQAEFRLDVVPLSADGDLSTEDVRAREAVLRDWHAGFARIEVPGNRVVEAIVRNNVRDYGSFPMLDGPADEWLALQAGMPLYPAFFGRDGVTAGWQAGLIDRGEALAAALTKLGRLQADAVDDWRDAEPGRIPYQIRRGPTARLGLNPYSAYYADFASPFMFVISLANLWAWTGERRHIERHWDTARRILEWARERGDRDGDGYLEYLTRSRKGTKNQGWKDSGDAIVYDDGSPVPAPIATCEVQGYWYVAQQLMGLLSWVMDARDDARAHAESAAALKQRFNRDWWMPDEPFYALALDPDKRQVRALTSNVGHCLASGIIDRDRLPAVVGRMFAPDMFSGWGVRTLSAAHAFYNPLSYHRGTVWAVEQATITFGLRRFGFDARAADLAQAQFELAELYPESRIPECVGGYARGERPVPGAYPRANAPQLWNATAFPLIVQTLLGVVPIASMQTLIVDPVLPPWMPELILRDVSVGSARATLRFWRDAGGASKWDVLHTQGTLHVIRQAALESLSATWSDRTEAVFQSALASFKHGRRRAGASKRGAA